MKRETKVASIPDIREDNVLEVLRSLKNVLQVREGSLGDPLDQNVTLRDLASLQLVEESSNGVGTVLSNGVVVGVRNPSLDNDGYDPSTDYTAPPVPSGLTAEGGFTNVYLSWDGAQYRNHAYTEVWRASVDNLGQAVLVGRSNTNLYTDPADEGQTYYYWIRFVSLADVAGAYNATPGTIATTAVSPGRLLELLTGQITESQLYQSLGDRINLIDGAEDVTNSVAWRVAQEAQARAADIQAEAANRAADLLAEASARQTSDSALQTQINTIVAAGSSDTATILAALQDEQTARISADSAEATARQTLATQMRGSYTGTDITQVTTGLLHSEATTRSTADSALSSQITALSSTVTNNYNTLNAAITTEATTRATADSAQTTQLNNLSSTVTNNYNTLNAAITSEASTRASADSSLSSQINVLSASFKGSQLGLPLTQWVLNGQTLTVVSDGKVGADVLRLGTTANAFPNQGTYVAIDPTKKYRVRFWARPSSDCNGALYFSLRQFTNTAGTAGPVNNGRSPYKPGPQSRSAHNATYGTDAWGEYSYIWSAADWQTGVKFFQPEFLNNFGGTAGFWEIQDFTLSDATALEEANAAIASEASTRASADSALSTQISTTSARLNSGGDIYTSIVTAQSTASAKNANFVQSTTPIATKVGDLWVDTGNGNILKQWNGSAWVTADDQRIGATATNVTTLTSRLNNASGSGVTMEQQFSTNASQITGLQGQYTVKIDLNGYVTGFGLASTATNGTPTSSFIVRADSFSISNPSGPSIAPSTPFIVRTTSTTINGQTVSPGVYLQDAFIQNGTITNAKIASLVADKITTGTLTATIGVNAGKIYGGVNPNGSALGSAGFGTGFLLGDYLGGNKFFIGSPTSNLVWDGTNLTVRGTIYATAGFIGQNIIDANGISSPNYVAGSTGWSVNKDGGAEFNQVTVRGDVISGASPAINGYQMTGSGARLYSDGRMVVGNSTNSLVWDGTNITVNGLVKATTTVLSNQAMYGTNIAGFTGTPYTNILTFTKSRYGKLLIGGVFAINVDSLQQFMTQTVWAYVQFGFEVQNASGSTVASHYPTLWCRNHDSSNAQQYYTGGSWIIQTTLPAGTYTLRINANPAFFGYRWLNTSGNYVRDFSTASTAQDSITGSFNTFVYEATID